MDNYYYNYLINSSCYKNLTSAINNLDIQVGNVTALNNALNNASGNNIVLMQNDLKGILKDLENYISIIKKIQSTLLSNANTFDTTLNTWKGRVGKDYFKPVNNQLVSSNLQTETYVYLSSSEKITGATVDGDGYVNVQTKELATHLTHDKKNDKKTKQTVINEDHSYQEEFGAESRFGWWN